ISGGGGQLQRLCGLGRNHDLIASTLCPLRANVGIDAPFVGSTSNTVLPSVKRQWLPTASGVTSPANGSPAATAKSLMGVLVLVAISRALAVTAKIGRASGRE